VVSDVPAVLLPSVEDEREELDIVAFFVSDVELPLLDP